ncbi:polymorphic toxin-type HINT domain-containing protein [Actimicrobium antarcticum]|uniref:Novel toxin 21 domain-containing protein n=1 Tax=Actimicrobium antarcticum TaxID=1051899 RepID=A0ABP7SZE9_9BURK
MLLMFLRHTSLQRFVAFLLLVVISATQGLSPLAQAATPVWQICNPPPVCFASKEAKQVWAEENHCRFIEDVCDQTSASADNKGASDADQGLWGSAWNDVKAGLVYGYEFVKGLLTGLKDQITDLLSLIGNLDDVILGLIDLGKAFYADPKGTLLKLAELLGQEAVDVITRATQCGAYDLGKVIGTYVSPAIMLKLATRLTKYAGKLSEAVAAVKHDFGCASFAAGTLVRTSQGLLPIEQITIGRQVASRHERSYADRPQAVTRTFGRIAPSYRLLQTEFDTFKLTDEHPLWVQGKGWTEARHITDDDVIAGQRGDALVLRNDAVALPLQVYNFSVAGTDGYFVGAGGVWAHNAKCTINRLRKANAEDAAKLGYDRLIKDPPFNPHGQKVFGNGKNFISPDVDGHNGGVWKLVNKKGQRIATLDGELKVIKD